MSYNIGLRLHNLRKTAHLSQEQTALDANTTPAYLGQTERNEKILQFWRLKSYVRYLTFRFRNFSQTTNP